MTSLRATSRLKRSEQLCAACTRQECRSCSLYLAGFETWKERSAGTFKYKLMKFKNGTLIRSAGQKPLMITVKPALLFTRAKQGRFSASCGNGRAATPTSATVCLNGDSTCTYNLFTERQKVRNMALSTTLSSCYNRAFSRDASLSRFFEDALSRPLGEAHLKRLCAVGATPSGTPTFFDATRTEAISTSFRKKEQLSKLLSYMDSFLTAKDAQRLIGGPGSAGLSSTGELRSNRNGSLAGVKIGHKLNSHGKRTSVNASASTSEVQTKTDMEEPKAVEGYQHVSEANSALPRAEG
jgi:hypothetical protein